MTIETPLPVFSSIDVAKVESLVASQIETNKNALSKQLSSLESPSWDSLITPIEESEDILNKLWSPIQHLNSVNSSPELRAAHDKAREKLSAYYTEFGQNEQVFSAYKAFRNSSAYAQLDAPKKTVVDHALRDFRLSGIELGEADKARYAEIRARLANLSSQFSNNVLDATEAWHFHTEDEASLAGLPDSTIRGAASNAQNKQKSGYLLKLDGPTYLAVLSQADSTELREAFYRAYCTRASDQGPNAGKWDNTEIIDEILALKKELAALLGMAHYAELSLATKMASSVEEVEAFLRKLAAKARHSAENDLKELQNFAKENDAVEELKPWDIAYYSEKLKRANYSVSQEELRQYFTLPKVLKGLFGLAETLFSIEIVEAEAPDLWHPSAQYYNIKKHGDVIAGFYTDLFTREGKRGGAWMDVCLTRRQRDEELQIPVAYLVCNFNPPIGDQPALLTHNEVTTLFHEFGHGLHHMLTEMDVAAVSGINGVEWDAVELPSQFLENWAWQPETLKKISAHVDTGDSIPEDLIEKMIAAKNFQSGLFILRQIEFGLFDILVHRDFGEPGFKGVQETLNAVRKDVAVIPAPEFNRFQNTFSHIFSGGYAAGYYSYLWAEVLSADAFAAFEEQDVFSKELGQKFVDTILSRGGSAPASELFVAFRGRAPSLDALLRHSGIK